MTLQAAPTLNTQRLVLRAFEPGDFADLCALWGDPEVVRHITGTPLSPQDVWARLLRNIGHWQVLGFGYWAVLDAGSNRFLGICGLAHYKRDVDTPLADFPEAGWVFAPHAQGKGYGQEAVNAVLRWSDEVLKPETVFCMIAPDHDASQRLARKVGFVGPSPGTYAGDPVFFFERKGVQE